MTNHRLRYDILNPDNLLKVSNKLAELWKNVSTAEKYNWKRKAQRLSARYFFDNFFKQIFLEHFGKFKEREGNFVAKIDKNNVML